ncbi:hypothetical protein CAL7716_100530 (plasmid) [Calothrix sp. PCC 7716]|nr:hypothetical protein CAL7716_100530 [Calothrix sp. PCC 7716]
MAVIDISGMGEYALAPFKVRKRKSFWYGLKALLSQYLQFEQGITWDIASYYKNLEDEMSQVYGKPGESSEQQTEQMLELAEKSFGYSPIELVIFNEEQVEKMKQYRQN